MNTTAAKILLIMIVGSSLTLPLVASAWTTPNLWGTPPGFWGPLVSCTGIYVGAPSTNPDNSPAAPPCTSLCDLIDTAINIIYFGMSLAIFILAPVMIVVGAVMVMLAGANPGMLESGKKTLTATVIGLAIVLCAYLIVNTTITVLGITGIGGFGNNACVTTS
jgi:hypothetical protein